MHNNAATAITGGEQHFNTGTASRHHHQQHEAVQQQHHHHHLKGAPLFLAVGGILLRFQKIKILLFVQINTLKFRKQKITSLAYVYSQIKKEVLQANEFGNI